MNAPAKFKARYATPAKVKAFIEVARELDIDVAGFEVSPEGVIRIMEARVTPATPANDYERYRDRM